MALAFQKYHGIGNDFLLVEVDDPQGFGVERAKRLCDRHFGVGGDGVLLMGPARTAGARGSMTVINSDGSTPEMCGNGLRCVALYLARKAGQKQSEFLVDTGAGPLLCQVEDGPTGAHITTDIGRGTAQGELSVTALGTEFLFHRLATGNPHAICFRAPITSELLDVVGPQVNALVAGGVNVEIAHQLGPREFVVAVWERGVGRTLACGTGAAATVIEAVRQGRSPSDTPVVVHLPGGPLTITVQSDSFARLSGPAAYVYAGTTDL